MAAAVLERFRPSFHDLMTKCGDRPDDVTVVPVVVVRVARPEVHVPSVEPRVLQRRPVVVRGQSAVC